MISRNVLVAGDFASFAAGNLEQIRHGVAGALDAISTQRTLVIYVFFVWVAWNGWWGNARGGPFEPGDRPRPECGHDGETA